MQSLLPACLVVVLSPLLASMVAGLGLRVLPRRTAHRITITGVMISFIASLYIAFIYFGQGTAQNFTVYEWTAIDAMRLQIGFLIDPLTILMMLVVTFVSWMVHIYTIGYMHDDPGYNRFFSYISLFTFSMLMLVMANNFLQLFFGWEAVGLVSYLLIGFWFKKDTAIFANLKAFLVNRVGDFGFLLGIGMILWAFGSLDYAVVFDQVPTAVDKTVNVIGSPWSVLSLTGILLFIGAMGKSAQIPLHVWLPDSMEGPTPISALIHAATMVTAGVFMVARLSPLYEYTQTALTVILVLGTATSFLMGLIGIVQKDIKRIIAYSTLSQLGYMMVALSVSAYAAGVFHLMTHAFFKALLFLGAGSVIIGMHHEQDIMKMGGLRKAMPITFATMLIGSLAIIGFPFFSGFYSKDTIIEAVHLSTLPGASIAYWFVLSGVFVTALYSFRLLFLVFFTQPRMDEDTYSHVKESPWVVCGPLILLAFFSIIAGYFIGNIFDGFFGESIFVRKEHDVMAILAGEYHGIFAMALHGFTSLPFMLAMAGVLVAWLFYVQCPSLARITRKLLAPVCYILENKYGFDALYQKGIAPIMRGVGRLFWRVGDQTLIDGMLVNGTANAIGRFSNVIRRLQTGYVYHYAFAMITGLIGLMIWLLWTIL